MNLNYAGPCWLATFVFSQIAFFMPGGAKVWFDGPSKETKVAAWVAAGKEGGGGGGAPGESEDSAYVRGGGIEGLKKGEGDAAC